MLTIHPIKSRDCLLVLVILFIATLLRFSHPTVVEFFHDDAMLSSLVQELVVGEKFPLVGILSSVGIPNPPTGVYLLAIPFAFSSDPMVAILFIMGWNVLGVVILWWIAHRYFGQTIGLIAGLVYAVNPWAIIFSRKIWAQEIHTPLILLAIALGLYGFWEQSKANQTFSHRIAQILCLPILVFALQIHFAAWALFPIFLILLLVGRKQISFIALGTSIVLTVLVLTPYAIGLKQTLDQDPRRITDAVNRSDANDGLRFSSDSLQSMAYLATGLGVETWVAPQQQADLLRHVPPLVPFWFLIGSSVFVGIFYLFQQKRFSFLSLLLVWAFLPAVTLIPVWTPIHTHYFVPSIPALALLIGIGIGGLATWLPYKPYSRIVVLSLLSVLLLTQAFWWQRLLDYLQTTEIAYPGFTTPIAYLDDVQTELAQYEDVVVVSYGMWWLLHHESIVWDVMLHDSVDCVRTVQDEGYAVFPNHPFAVVVAPDADDNPVLNIYDKPNPENFSTRGDDMYSVRVFEEASHWTATPIQTIDPIMFESGVQLNGYHLEENRMVLRWSLPARNKDLNYQYSGQFLDADGQALGQRDVTFWQGRHWCEGDTLITWTDIQLPEDTATLRVSLYELGTGKDAGQYFSANVVDTLGNPVGQWVDILLSTR